MPEFKLASDFQPTGDQPQAIEKLVEGIDEGCQHQTLLGVTGSGKTFTIANVIARIQKPTLVLSHNKTLAAQLCTEFHDFFPENAVEYFVSYYDYYQPEAYIPRTDTYIEKETDVNEEIDKLRNSATRSVVSRNDVVVCASVSCIYGLGAPDEYFAFMTPVKKGDALNRDRLARRLAEMQYERNDIGFTRGKFRIRGDTLEIQPAYEDLAFRIEFWGNEVERIRTVDPLSGEVLGEEEEIEIYPAKHFVTSPEKLAAAIEDIKAELEERVAELKLQEKLVEAQRLRDRTNYDIEMLREAGYCNGVENYSRHLTRRQPGTPPWTLIDYFPDDFLLIIDESHMSIPQVRGMYRGDRARKDILVEYGFRLPSAIDNRPLTFEEFESRIGQVIFTSATPGP
ncbi:MAG: DEAD/DEAH box helicase family protein, partial [Dehalococcoidia bacterium]